ncbi:major histocompatibility complex class I-related gene protein-like isoform X2 [Colossoma macropomum]|uniref:major histocompatibility complex class I-related gene protein-like isoform X2 n=1 Tax=Colossoma macropomum TaxID=42526 RepID=UPI00186469DE|nr:major histocompatibility complex class I-related gene protein-like isoform X2 [Colossoma macropomum]
MKHEQHRNMNRFYILLNVLTFAAAAVNTGETPFPEFTVLTMLDDILMTYYDSVEEKAVMKVGQQLNEEKQTFADMIFGALHEGMRDQANFLKRHFNYTNGVHAEQRLDCCELLSHNKPGGMKMFDAFNGLNGMELDYDVHHHALHTETKWPIVFDTVKLEYNKKLYAYFLHPVCIEALETALKELKNHVFRKVKPRVRLMMKPHADSGGARVSCLATGFYPRHVNLTLLRNGQPVSEHLVSGGELLPNGDGTYQMRKSLEISAEELQQKNNYTCTATHLSLDNKLDIHWDYDPGPPTAVIASTVLLVILVCLVAPIAVFIMWKKRHVVSRTSSQSDYSAASTTEEKELEELKN